MNNSLKIYVDGHEYNVLFDQTMDVAKRQCYYMDDDNAEQIIDNLFVVNNRFVTFNKLSSISGSMTTYEYTRASGSAEGPGTFDATTPYTSYEFNDVGFNIYTVQGLVDNIPIE